MFSLKKSIIYYLIFELFLLPIFGLTVIPKKVKAAGEACTLTVGYKVAADNINVFWTSSRKPQQTVEELIISIDYTQNGGESTNDILQSNPYQISNAGSLKTNIPISIMLVQKGTTTDKNPKILCQSGVTYAPGSTSGGDLSGVASADPCQGLIAPTAFVTTIQNTTKVEMGNVGIQIIWKGSANGAGTIYQDGTVIASNITQKYTSNQSGAGSGNANMYKYETSFPHTESHSWQVTEKIKDCAKESPKSNTVKFEGTSGTVDQGGAEAEAPGAIGGNPKGYMSEDAEYDNCSCGNRYTSWFTNPLCTMMCVFINGIIKIMDVTLRGFLNDAVQS